MARVLTCGALITGALLIQLTVAAAAPVPGAVPPDLVLLVAVAIALTRGPLAGTVAGFCCGLALDLAPPATHLAGTYALAFCLAGYTCGRAARLAAEPVVRSAAAALGAVGGTALATLAGAAFGDATVSWAAAAGLLPVSAAYDAVLSPFVLYAVARLTGAAGRPAAAFAGASPAPVRLPAAGGRLSGRARGGPGLRTAAPTGLRRGSGRPRPHAPTARAYGDAGGWSGLRNLACPAGPRPRRPAFAGARTRVRRPCPRPPAAVRVAAARAGRGPGDLGRPGSLAPGAWPAAARKRTSAGFGRRARRRGRPRGPSPLPPGGWRRHGGARLRRRGAPAACLAARPGGWPRGAVRVRFGRRPGPAGRLRGASAAGRLRGASAACLAARPGGWPRGGTVRVRFGRRPGPAGPLRGASAACLAARPGGWPRAVRVRFGRGPGPAGRMRVGTSRWGVRRRPGRGVPVRFGPGPWGRPGGGGRRWAGGARARFTVRPAVLARRGAPLAAAGGPAGRFARRAMSVFSRAVAPAGRRTPVFGVRRGAASPLWPGGRRPASWRTSGRRIGGFG